MNLRCDPFALLLAALLRIRARKGRPTFPRLTHVGFPGEFHPSVPKSQLFAQLMLPTVQSLSTSNYGPDRWPMLLQEGSPIMANLQSLELWMQRFIYDTYCDIHSCLRSMTALKTLKLYVDALNMARPLSPEQTPWFASPEVLIRQIPPLQDLFSLTIVFCGAGRYLPKVRFPERATCLQTFSRLRHLQLPWWMLLESPRKRSDLIGRVPTSLQTLRLTSEWENIVEPKWTQQAQQAFRRSCAELPDPRLPDLTEVIVQQESAWRNPSW